jgi:hypothetical protein
MKTGEKLDVAVHGIEIRSDSSVGKRVSPGKKKIKGNQYVDWKNLAHEKVRVTFPNADRVFSDFPSSGYAEIEFTEVDRYHIKEHPIHGEYPYQVLGLESGDYYIDDSDPRIDVL